MVEYKHTIAALMGTLLFASCRLTGPVASADPPLATLGQVILRESDFERFMRSAFPTNLAAGIRARPDARQEAIEAWLDVMVQAAKARKEGIDRLPTFQKALELMDMKLLVQDLIARNRAGLAKPTDLSEAEIQQYYHSHPNHFQFPPGSGANGRQPLQDVRNEIAKQLVLERNSRFHRTFLEDLRAEMNFRQTDDAHPEASLLDPKAVAAGTTIAFIGAVRITEADFQWFLKDAYRAEQRQQAFSRPAARQRLLADFLSMRLMEAKATKLGLNKTAQHRAELELAELRLLTEFLLERDGMTPWKLPGTTDEERAEAFRNYMNRLRSEMGLTLLSTSPNGR
jgi:hypothetical protein